MSEKSKLDTKKDDVPENFFLASKKDGHQMTVYYSQAACAVLEEWKKQGKGTKNQFISDAIVEYGMARFGGCPACFLILKGVVISSHETNRFS